MRHTAHRHGIAALFVSRCQRNLQLARADDGVFKEQFIKITQTKEEQRPGMLRFQLPVLPNHWSGVTSSHACASEKSVIKTDLNSLVCVSEEAYMVRREGASTYCRCMVIYCGQCLNFGIQAFRVPT